MVRFSRIRSPKPRLSILAVTVLALLSIGGATAAGAQAHEWSIGGRTLVERGLSSEKLAGSGSGIQITSTVLGTPFEANCSAATTQGSISNAGGGTSAISLSGCSVAKPAGCVFKESPVLEASVQLVEVGGTLYEKFVPPPEQTRFGLLKLINCAATGSYPLNGSFASLSPQTANPVQSSSFSAAVNSAAGAELKLGTKAAGLTGTVAQYLNGPFYSQGWRANVGGFQEINPGDRVPFSISGGPVEFVHSYGGSVMKWSCGKVTGNNGYVLYGGAETGLTFGGCKIVEPAGCTISENLSTAYLNSLIHTIGGYQYETLTPKGAQVLMTVKVSNCAWAGSYQVTGSVTAKGKQAGYQAESQPFEFSKAADEAAGTSLKWGTELLIVSGTMNWSLLDGNRFEIK